MAEKEILPLKAMECSEGILKSRQLNGKRPNFSFKADQHDDFIKMARLGILYKYQTQIK